MKRSLPRLLRLEQLARENPDLLQPSGSLRIHQAGAAARDPLAGYARALKRYTDFIVHFPYREEQQEIPGHEGMGIRRDPASDTFKLDASGVVTCGFARHTRVAAKDYIFTAYGKR